MSAADEVTVEDLDAVAAMLPEVMRVEARPSEERGGERQADGTMVMPYVEEAPELGRLRQALRPLLIEFDWGKWQDEARRFAEPAAVATATLDEVRRLFTLHVRKDRFCEGHFAEMVSAGHITALLRRVGALAEQMRAPDASKGGDRARPTLLRMQQGDITRVEVDAIVNAANSALCGGGGVDGAIHDAAGPELLAACRALGRCDVGDAKITPGFRLAARWVIHAVGPVWRGGDANEAALLAATYRASLDLAIAHECRTVAFPAISCGAYRYPIGAACAVAVSTIRAWCAEHPGLREVVLVAYEPVVAKAMARALA